ncbi:MAG: type II toxin-antitoxin system VapC family toxin [Desulfuromonadales bacterium]
MTAFFIDTNLFIRYLTNDDAEKADRVERLLADAAAGKVKLITAEMVMAETVWVLESAYGLNAAEIAPLIRAILASPGLEVIGSPLVERALVHYETKGVDFIDGYIVALMERHALTGLYSFDKKHLGRFEGIERKEP